MGDGPAEAAGKRRVRDGWRTHWASPGAIPRTHWSLEKRCSKPAWPGPGRRRYCPLPFPPGRRGHALYPRAGQEGQGPRGCGTTAPTPISVYGGEQGYLCFSEPGLQSYTRWRLARKNTGFESRGDILRSTRTTRISNPERSSTCILALDPSPMAGLLSSEARAGRFLGRAGSNVDECFTDDIFIFPGRPY
ncbi:hypothetical protein LY76DRAFT_236394 [Colletotrichum caudatum]|nr:hypothetical protein LY76DRAFT_236394 [Colletotrichum caudatum]